MQTTLSPPNFPFLCTKKRKKEPAIDRLLQLITIFIFPKIQFSISLLVAIVKIYFFCLIAPLCSSPTRLSQVLSSTWEPTPICLSEQQSAICCGYVHVSLAFAFAIGVEYGSPPNTGIASKTAIAKLMILRTHKLICIPLSI